MTFFTSSNKKGHKELHNTERNHRCEICDKSFKTPETLRKHEAIHQGKGTATKSKTFASCDECGSSFSSGGSLKVHKRIHSNEKPFPCIFCGKFYRQEGHLSEHTKVHSGETPHPCLACKKAFRTPRQLRLHVANIHSVILAANANGMMTWDCVSAS